MKLEITPEPSPAERKAIERALALALAGARRPESAWREQGVRESTERWRRHPTPFDAGAGYPPGSGGGASSEETWSDTRIVQPGDPGQHQRDE